MKSSMTFIKSKMCIKIILKDGVGLCECRSAFRVVVLKMFILFILLVQSVLSKMYLNFCPKGYIGFL